MKEFNKIGCNELENPIGIETLTGLLWNGRASYCCNELENPIGIETNRYLKSLCKTYSCNELENPIGIETAEFSKELGASNDFVATNLKTR